MLVSTGRVEANGSNMGKEQVKRGLRFYISGKHHRDENSNFIKQRLLVQKPKKDKIGV